MSREREYVVMIPGGSAGAVGAFFLAVVLLAVALLVTVAIAFPDREYSTVPTTRQLGPCAPFCSLRTTTVVPPIGGTR